VTAVVLALTAGFVFGSHGPALRHGLTKVRDAELASFHCTAFGLFAALTVAAAAGKLDDFSVEDAWPFLLIGVLVPGISQVMFVRAIRDIGASRAMTLTATIPLVAGVAAILFLDEPLRAALVVGTILVVGGAASLAWDRTRPEDWRSTGVIWALAGIVLWASRDTSARWLIGERDVPGVIAAMSVLLTGTLTQLGFLIVMRRGSEPLAQIRASWRPFVLAGLGFGLGYSAVLAALEHGKVTVVSPLNATFALWGVVISALLLRRIEAVTVRVGIAAVLIVSGSAVVAATR
jgi:drug/metabolite transporter (DMT)-like permease